MILHLQHWGYLGLFVGTFLEGETVVVLAGLAAHQGYLDIRFVILAAFLGSLAGDQLYFQIGRNHGKAFLEKRPAWQARVDSFNRRLHRFRILAILSFRFLYGLRTIAPFAIGMSEVPTPLFIFFNALGAAIWALAIGLAGYFAGNAVEGLLDQAKSYEFYIFGAVALAGALFYLIRAAMRKRTPG